MTIMEFYKSLSKLEKDNALNIIASFVIATYVYIVSDYNFLGIFLFCIATLYILDTISYFREYLTSERRYTINIDNGIQEVTLNLYNPQWEKTHSWNFSKDNLSTDEWTEN